MQTDSAIPSAVRLGVTAAAHSCAAFSGASPPTGAADTATAADARAAAFPRAPIPPTAYGARPSDIVHVRGTGLAARAIRHCLPLAWGNHDATLIYITPQIAAGMRLRWTGWAVAEAEPPRFRLTRWPAYWRGLRKHRWQLVFLRVPHLPAAIAGRVEEHALAMAACRPRYDRLAILGHFFACITRANLRWGRQWQWYCTEAVAEQYYIAGHGARWCPWGITSMPTPFTTERRVLSGSLEIIGGSAMLPDPGIASFAEHLAALADRLDHRAPSPGPIPAPAPA